MKCLLTSLAVMTTVLAVFATPCVAEPPIPANYGLKKIAAMVGVPAAALAGQGLDSLPTEQFCMGLAIYHEARGETITGRLAVARVILNRTRSKAYPATVCRVVFQGAPILNRCQFSFACDEISDVPRNIAAWLKALALARAALQDGATDCLIAAGPREIRDGDFDKITHYHADYVAPFWSSKIDRIGEIGRHVFYRSPRVARTL